MQLILLWRTILRPFLGVEAEIGGDGIFEGDIGFTNATTGVNVTISSGGNMGNHQGVKWRKGP